MPKKQKKSSSKPSKKPKTILFIVDAWFPFVGGGQIYARELKEQLELQNYRVLLAHPPHSHILVRALWSLCAPFFLAMKYAMDKPDLIHSQGYHSGFVGHLMSKSLDIPVIHTVHGANLLDLKSSSLKAKLEKFLLTKIRYTHQISVSQSFLEYENVNTVSFIPNGVDVATFDAVENREADPKRILWIGRDDSVKGYDLFLETLDLVISRDPEVTADIILSGKLTKEELIRRYKKAAILVISSRSEGLPLVLLEAWAAKTPVVAFGVGEIPRLMKESGGGVTIEPNNTKALATALLDMLENKIRAASFGYAGYLFVKENYTWENIATKTIKIYEKNS